MQNCKCISRTTLKLIACVSMLIDHTCIVFMSFNPDGFNLVRNTIGRIAFPIYVFLLVDGFFRTKKPLKKVIDLLLFGIISELPFDIILNNNSMNMMFTLCLGFLLLTICENMYNYVKDKQIAIFCNIIVYIMLSIIVLLFNTDYNVTGMTAIFLCYVFMRTEKFKNIAPIITSIIIAIGTASPFTIIAFPLMICCDTNSFGKRNVFTKYMFYAFYPLHLCILAIIKLMLLI